MKCYCNQCGAVNTYTIEDKDIYIDISGIKHFINLKLICEFCGSDVNGDPD
jgi:hypothetical protein